MQNRRYLSGNEWNIRRNEIRLHEKFRWDDYFWKKVIYFVSNFVNVAQTGAAFSSPREMAAAWKERKNKTKQNVHRPLLVDISHLANKKKKETNRTLPDINRLLQSFFIIFEKIAFTQMPINWPLVKAEEIRVNFFKSNSTGFVWRNFINYRN